MKIQLFNENEWIFPDQELVELSSAIAVETARGANVGFQVLTDVDMKVESGIVCEWEAPAQVSLIPYQLMPARVEANSDRKSLTTQDYDSVADFVTRKAPFFVYDVARDLDGGNVLPGRGAFYFRISVAPDAKPGQYDCRLMVRLAEESFSITVQLTVFSAVVPDAGQGRFGMVNWLNLDHVQKQHNLERGSEDFWAVVKRYMENQLDMRSNHLMLSSGVPVRDKEGKVIDFDFSEAVREGNMALEAGYRYIYGGFVARFIKWDEERHFLLWDREVDCSSFEGYRQLKIYFSKLWGIVQEQNWEKNYMQCMVDEPQFPNSEHYRILAGICRKCMPGVVIHDPVESTELGGAVDIWCVKQAVFDKHLEQFQKLQAIGEEMWIYTCGFPSGWMMNRVLDLPLLVSRLPMWMCCGYDVKGFLHWGYNAYSDKGDPFMNTCYSANGSTLMPSGNGFVVYPGDGRPWYSMRGHLQRAAAEDAELLMQLLGKDEAAAKKLIGCICTNFLDYNSSVENFERVRHELLVACSQ